MSDLRRQWLLELEVYRERELVVFIKHPSDQLLQHDYFQGELSEMIYQSLRGIDSENNFKPTEFLFPDLSEHSELGMAARKKVAHKPPQNSAMLLQDRTHMSDPHYLEIISSRAAAPISYMIARHPEDVIGPVKEVAVLKGPRHGRRKAVMIALRMPLQKER